MVKIIDDTMLTRGEFAERLGQRPSGFQANNSTPIYDPFAPPPHRVMWKNPLSSKQCRAEVFATPGATGTFTRVGFPTDPTHAGATPANGDNAYGAFAKSTGSTTVNTDAGWAILNTAAYTLLRSTWMPDIGIDIFTGTGILTSGRTWVGLFSGDPMASVTPAVSLAAFRFDTATDTDGYWRACTKDGTTLNAQNTYVPVANSAYYNMNITFIGAPGANPVGVGFSINGFWLCSAPLTANLPATGSNNLAIVVKTRTLVAGTAQIINLGRVTVAH